MNETLMNEPDVGAPAGIILHGPEEFVGMRNAGRLAAECLDMIKNVVPGVTTDHLNKICRIYA